MGKIIIDTTPEEDEAFRKAVGSRTQREAVFDAMGIPCKERIVGRPAFDAAEREKRLMAIHLEKIREYNQAHQSEADEARRVLGIDGKKGSVSGFFLKDKLKRRV